MSFLLPVKFLQFSVSLGMFYPFDYLMPLSLSRFPGELSLCPPSFFFVSDYPIPTAYPARLNLKQSDGLPTAQKPCKVQGFSAWAAIGFPLILTKSFF